MPKKSQTNEYSDSNYPAQWSRVLSRDGIQQRRNSWQDGVAGTNCPIPPGQSWTYHFKLKDQLGSYFYYPSLLFQKAAGGFGSIRVNPRSIIPSPFAPPADDFVVLIGDWYKTNHKVRSSFKKKKPLHQCGKLVIVHPVGTCA